MSELSVGQRVAVRIVNEDLGVAVTDWHGEIVMLCPNGKVAVQFRGGKKGRGKRSEMVCDRSIVHPLGDDAEEENRDIKEKLLVALKDKFGGEHA